MNRKPLWWPMIPFACLCFAESTASSDSWPQEVDIVSGGWIPNGLRVHDRVRRVTCYFTTYCEPSFGNSVAGCSSSISCVADR